MVRASLPRLLQQPEVFNRRARFLRRFLKDRLPAAPDSGFNVFRAVVEVKDFAAAPPGFALDDFVNFWVGLHRAVFVGQNVAGEVFEEWKTLSNVADGQRVRVGENPGRETFGAKL